MDSLIRIGGRLFNLTHVITMDPGEDKGEPIVDVHVVPGRVVRLKGRQARAATVFIESFPDLVVEVFPEDPDGLEGEAAQDHGYEHNPQGA